MTRRHPGETTWSDHLGTGEHSGEVVAGVDPSARRIVLPGSRDWLYEAVDEGRVVHFDPFAPPKPFDGGDSGGSILLSILFLVGGGVGGYLLGDYYAPRGQETWAKVGGAVGGVVAGAVINQFRNVI